MRQGEYEQQPRGCFVVAKLKGAAAKLAVTVNLGNTVVTLEHCVHSAACQSERQCRRLSSALRHDETKGVGGRLQFPSSAIRYCSRSRGSHLLPTLLAISALRSSIPFQSHHGTIVNFIILCTRLPSAYCLAATRTELRADPRLRPPWAPANACTRLHRRLALQRFCSQNKKVLTWTGFRGIRKQGGVCMLQAHHC